MQLTSGLRGFLLPFLLNMLSGILPSQPHQHVSCYQLPRRRPPPAPCFHGGPAEAICDSGATNWKRWCIGESGDAQKASVFTNMLIYAAVKAWSVAGDGTPAWLSGMRRLSQFHAPTGRVCWIPQTQRRFDSVWVCEPITGGAVGPNPGRHLRHSGWGCSCCSGISRSLIWIVCHHWKIRAFPLNLPSPHDYLWCRYSVDSSIAITTKMITAGHLIAFKVYWLYSCKSCFTNESTPCSGFPRRPSPTERQLIPVAFVSEKWFEISCWRVKGLLHFLWAEGTSWIHSPVGARPLSPTVTQRLGLSRVGPHGDAAPLWD